MSVLVKRLRRFRRDQSGAMSVEAVLVLPVLLWLFMATFVYWDAFRANNTHIKATFTVSDMISREMSSIDMAYIEGLHSVYRFVASTREPTWMRITNVQFDGTSKKHQVLWSRTTSTTGAPELTSETLQALLPRIPTMSANDTVIIVETWRRYTPAFNVGIDTRVMNEFSVIRPRFLSPIPIS